MADFYSAVDKWNGGEEAAREAQKQITRRIRERDRECYPPFYERTDSLLAAFESVPGKLLLAIEPHLQQLSKQLEASIELAKQPRQMRALYLGSDRMLSLAFLSGCAAFVLFFGVLIGQILPGQFNSWSVWQAKRLIDGPAQMCRVVNGEYGTDDCLVPGRERDLGLRIIAREDRR